MKKEHIIVLIVALALLAMAYRLQATENRLAALESNTAAINNQMAERSNLEARQRIEAMMTMQQEQEERTPIGFKFGEQDKEETA